MSVDLKIFVGKKSKYFEDSIDAARFSEFASVTGAPAFFTGKVTDTSQVPNLFTIFRSGEFELMAQMGLKLQQILHGEQEYEFREVLKVDQKMRYQTELLDVIEKKGKEGSLYFLIFSTPFERAIDNAILAVAKSTMVFRESVR